MNQVQPAITYSPEGVLTVQRARPLRNVFADRSVEELRDRTVAFLTDAFDMVTVEVDEFPERQQVHLPVAQVLGEREEELEPGSALVVRAVDVLRRHGRPAGDEVILPRLEHERQMRATVFEPFQRFLNSGLDETTARLCLAAMAVPYGREAIEETRDDFTYEAIGDGVLASARHFAVALFPETMKMPLPTPEDDRIMALREGKWHFLRMSVNRDAVIGASAEERSPKHSPQSGALYNMLTHNIDTSQEILSLMLGLGSLAHHAVRHEGQDDIFAHLR